MSGRCATAGVATIIATSKAATIPIGRCIYTVFSKPKRQQCCRGGRGVQVVPVAQWSNTRLRGTVRHAFMQRPSCYASGRQTASGRGVAVMHMAMVMAGGILLLGVFLLFGK